MPKSLKWPMTVGADGVFETTSSFDEIIGGRIRSVLSTRLGERVMRTGYGTEPSGSLFESLGASSEESIRTAIRSWVPDAVVDAVLVERDGGAIVVRVKYHTTHPGAAPRELSLTRSES